MTPDVDQTLASVSDILKQAKSILFITGAGISAESGIPTYRGVGGLYNVDDLEEGCTIEEALSSGMLASHPEITWKYLLQIGEAVRGASFNRAHEIIAEMESHFPRVWTLTQNVDGFHSAAGSNQVIEAHGNMHSLFCQECGRRSRADETPIESLPPLCTQCDGLVRPDVVLFGELLSGSAVETMQRELERGFDLVFSIGTSSVFPYIQAPLELARSEGVPTVEINPCETTATGKVDFQIPLPATQALEELWLRCRQIP